MTPRAPLSPDPALVKHQLQRDLVNVLARLGIHDRDVMGKITPLNPTRRDRRPGSFVIWTQGDAAGAWRDYATGESGDLYGLIEYLGGLARWIDAYHWGLAHLGLEAGVIRSKEQDQADRERLARERTAEAARAEKLAAEKSAALFGLWLSLPASLAGTPAERYLREARGLPLDRLPYPPAALRWCEAADWTDPETGEIKTWRHVMVAAVSCAGSKDGKGAGDRVTGLHRTYLKSDGSGKAEGRSKFMIGTTRGGAIRLARGAGGLTPAKAAAKGKSCPLILGEGIETVLTAAIARPDYRAWAAGSLAHMGAIAWPDCASAVVLLREAGDHPEAVTAFERVLAHWQDQSRGRPVVVVDSPAGTSDLNDLVKA
jgi:hypothetical protein